MDWFFLFSGSDSKVSDIDGQPYTTLLYSNGPGYTQPRNIMREAGKDSIQVREVHSHFRTRGRLFASVYWIGEWSSGEIARPSLENPSRIIHRCSIVKYSTKHTSDCPLLQSCFFQASENTPRFMEHIQWTLNVYNIASSLKRAILLASYLYIKSDYII